MLLIYVPKVTNRVGYTLNVIFRHILKSDFEITTDVDFFAQHKGAKLCYAPRKVGDGLFVKSTDLLFRTTIEEQSPQCFSFDGLPALFPVHNAESALPFDIFAAAFYCLSRYEEYLPHLTDIHGRFPASESLSYKEGFLQKAVVDRWSFLLASKISGQYEDFRIPAKYFEYEDTFDIDAAYCYRNKGLMRTMSGLARDTFLHWNRGEIRRRLRVIFGREQDPFDTFEYILAIHGKYHGMKLKFFPLMADYNVYDKSISYQNTEFRQLLQHLCDYSDVGLHASYASHDDKRLLTVESERLAAVLHRNTELNRYHFLRLSLPNSYNVLIDNGITHDYTMGFADEPGFRAGTCSSYPFFYLESDCETSLTIHPFAIMDTTMVRYKKMSPENALSVYRSLMDEVKEVNGTFCTLWHNQNLCECFGWEGWRNVYESVLCYADQLKKNITVLK